ncbi:MAG: hypothetical protein R3B07_35530 [Polyangiaceae bacterium]
MKTQAWHTGFIQSLEEASDIEAQKAAWVDRRSTHFPEPAELICQMFDDSGIDDLLAEGAVFSETTDAALRRLSKLAARLTLDESPERLALSDEWGEFARETARVLALVKEELVD